MAVRQASLSSISDKKEYTTVSAGFVSLAVTGGSQVDVPDYNGSGQTWRVVTFSSSGTMGVVQDGASERNPGNPNSAIAARVLAVGGGGNGAGGGSDGGRGGAGGGGGVFRDDNMQLTPGNYPFTVGAGRQETSAFGATCGFGGNGAGGFSFSAGGAGSTGSGGGGNGGQGGFGSRNWENSAGAASNGENAIQSDITGTLTWFGRAGKNGHPTGAGDWEIAGTGSGGHNGGVWYNSGYASGTGKSGSVIVAFPLA